MNRNESIHSGHFMTSKVHETTLEDEDEDDDEPIDVLTICEGEKEPPKKDAAKPVTFYKFGPKQTKSVTIDASLRKLKDTVAVSYAKLTTPKWKNFKGLRLKWQDRVRVNNVIWRAWHMEFQAQRIWKNKVCFFTMPEEDVHNRAEASILEGMYWKRRLESICYQYKRWRLGASAKKLRRRMSRGDSSTKLLMWDDSKHWEEGGHDMLLPMPPPQQSNTPTYNLEDDDFNNVFTDRLFESLVKPFMFPNPREINSQANNADIIQPSLMQLQPSLEDIMASLDSDFPDRDPALNSTVNESSTSNEDNVLLQLDRHNSHRCANKGQYATLKVMPECGDSGPPSAGSYTSRDYLAANLLTELSSTQISPSASALFSPSLQGAHLPTFPVTNTMPALLYSQAAGYEPSNAYLSAPDNGGYSAEPYMPQVISASKNLNVATISPGANPLWPHQFEHRFTLNQVPPNVTLHPTPVRSPTSKGALKMYPAHGGGIRGRGRGRGRAGRPPKVTPKPIDAPRSSTIESSAPCASAFSPISPSRSLAQPQARFNHASLIQNEHVVSDNGPTSSQPLLLVQPMKLPMSSISSYPAYVTSPSIIKQEDEKSPGSPVSMADRLARKGFPKNFQLGKATKRAAADSTVDPNERKRMQHLHAEQSRRSALKGGFELLEELLPNLHSVGSKPTNAVVLQKAGEYIRELSNCYEDNLTDVDEHRTAIEHLNQKISAYQSHLPTSSGSNSSRSALQQQYTRYIRDKTCKNWKFWIFNKIVGDLFESYRTELDSKEPEETKEAAEKWASCKCNVVSLRPVVSKVLVELATETSILSAPHTLKQHVMDTMSIRR